jgi:hypothetical protein
MPARRIRSGKRLAWHRFRGALELSEILRQPFGTHYEVRIVVTLGQFGILRDDHLVEHLTEQRY